MVRPPGAFSTLKATVPSAALRSRCGGLCRISTGAPPPGRGPLRMRSSRITEPASRIASARRASPSIDSAKWMSKICSLAPAPASLSTRQAKSSRGTCEAFRIVARRAAASSPRQAWSSGAVLSSRPLWRCSQPIESGSIATTTAPGGASTGPLRPNSQSSPTSCSRRWATGSCESTPTIATRRTMSPARSRMGSLRPGRTPGCARDAACPSRVGLSSARSSLIEDFQLAADGLCLFSLSRQINPV